MTDPMRLMRCMTIILAFTFLSGCNVPLSSQSPMFPPPLLNTDAPATAPQRVRPEGWVTYTNEKYQFSIDYPPEFRVSSENDPNSSGHIGERIQYLISKQDPLACRGDCPVVQHTDTGLIVGGNEATRVEGYIGSIGGNVPQEYISYIIPRNGSYYIFTAYALAESEQATVQDFSKVYTMNLVDVTLFEQILSTLRFEG